MATAHKVTKGACNRCGEARPLFVVDLLPGQPATVRPKPDDVDSATCAFCLVEDAGRIIVGVPVGGFVR